MSDPRRQLPSVDRLLEAPEVAALDAPHDELVAGARGVLDAVRAELSAGAALPAPAELAARVVASVRAAMAPVLPATINATGIVLHTGLGRAPLPVEAVDAIGELARAAAPVELDLHGGTRGRRATIVEPLLCALTGAEAATVVNNNAAATLLTLAALAREREVVVSRGELVEIGGSFRLPDVMELGRATLHEVGTTNRTRLADYAHGISERTAALLKVHPSNYRVEGFTSETTIDELVALGRERALHVIHDVGSGALRDLAALGVTDEPIVAESIRAGADVVLFSGDKLLGGPQCGIIVGRRDAIAAIERHPLMRAVRVGKLTLAALGATLQLHRDARTAMSAIPAYALLAASIDTLRERADAIVTALNGVVAARVVDTDGYAGGGSVPQRAIPSIAVAIDAPDGADALAAALRAGTSPVVSRIADGAVCLELRTIFPEQDRLLIDALRAALAE